MATNTNTYAANGAKKTNLKDKKCYFCENKIKGVDYKNIPALKKFTNYFSKIKPRYYTGVCLKHQKCLSLAVKRARFIALIPFYR